MAKARRRTQIVCLLLVCGACGSPEPDPSLAPPSPAIDLGRVDAALGARIESLRRELQASADEPPKDSASRALDYGELGNLYHIAELLDAAEIAYDQAGRLAPTDVRWPYYLGMVRQTRGELAAASESFTAAAHLAPEDPAARLRLGEVQLELGLLDEALESFTRALALAPDNAAASYGLGRCAAIARKSQEAIAHFERALELQPEATAVHYPLAQEYRKLGDSPRSQFHLERRGDRAVRFSDPLADRLSETKTLTAFVVISTLAGNVAELADEDFLGFVLEQVAQVEGAAQALEARLEEGPPETLRGDGSQWSARMHYAAGGLLARVGSDVGAVDHFRAALELRPSLLDAAFREANALARMGRFDSAVDAYARVLEFRPSDRQARLNRSTALLNLGRFDSALGDLRQLIELDGRDGQAHALVGLVLVQSGDPRGAQRAFEDALASDLTANETAAAHRQLGRLLAESGQPEEALGHFRAVLALDPDGLAARLDLAGTLARLERYGEALVEYDRVLAVQASFPREALDPGLELDRARVLTRLGRFGEARDQLEATVSQWPEQQESVLLLARLLASSPDDSVRDGHRALAFAGTLFQAAPSASNAEVTAMALAEVGRFEEAAALQRKILDEAASLGSEDAQRRLRETLARYERGLPARYEPAPG